MLIRNLENLRANLETELNCSDKDCESNIREKNSNLKIKEFEVNKYFYNSTILLSTSSATDSLMHH